MTVEPSRAVSVCNTTRTGPHVTLTNGKQSTTMVICFLKSSYGDPFSDELDGSVIYFSKLTEVLLTGSSVIVNVVAAMSRRS
jgi:hypothetical protein